MHVHWKVWGAASGTATTVNCWIRFSPTFNVTGATWVVMSTMFMLKAELTEGVEVNAAVMVDVVFAVDGAW